MYSRYAGYDFNGLVWWEDKLGYWAVEIWQYKEYKATIAGEYFDELVREIQELYGNG